MRWARGIPGSRVYVVIERLKNIALHRAQARADEIKAGGGQARVGTEGQFANEVEAFAQVGKRLEIIDPEKLCPNIYQLIKDTEGTGLDGFKVVEVKKQGE